MARVELEKVSKIYAGGVKAVDAIDLTIKDQEFIVQQMEQFFFGEGAALPPEYVPPKKKA